MRFQEMFRTVVLGVDNKVKQLKEVVGQFSSSQAVPQIRHVENLEIIQRFLTHPENPAISAAVKDDIFPSWITEPGADQKLGEKRREKTTSQRERFENKLKEKPEENATQNQRNRLDVEQESLQNLTRVEISTRQKLGASLFMSRKGRVGTGA